MNSENSQTLPTSGRWNIDEVHSTAIFAIRHHAVGTLRIGFAEPAGVYDAESRELVGKVKIANIQAPAGLLYRHLQTPDFFDAEQHPAISFRSSTVMSDSEGQLRVEGDLTIRGITKRVHADGAMHLPHLVSQPDGSEAYHFGIDLGATIDRRDYGVTFNTVMPGGIENLGWDVRIEIALELIDGKTFHVRDFG